MASVTTMHPQQPPQIGLLSSTQGQPQLTRVPSQPLRRAVYIHVSDLISSYNIDHVKLEEELERVKADRDTSDSKSITGSRTNVNTSGNYRVNSTIISNSSNESNASMGGIPTELEARDPQKRLQPPRGGHNMVVLVGKVKIVVDKYRVDGSRVRLAEVEVGDETGIVSLRARDQQIDIVQALAACQGAIVLRNCTLELYQGKHIRLAITKWGKLSRYPDNVASTPPPPSKLNRDRNFSFIDLSKVASEMIAFSSLSIQSPSDSSHPSYGKQQLQHQHQHSHVHVPDTDLHLRQTHQQHNLQQRRNKGRGKQSNRKQQQQQHPSIVTGSSTGGTLPSGIQYQLIDHGLVASGNIRYNPHGVSQAHAQGSLHVGPYGNTNVYSTHPHHQSVASAGVTHHVPGHQQHYQYHHNRQLPDTIVSAGHHQQQQQQQQQHILYHQQQQQQQHQQYELQQRQMQQMYHQQASSDRGGVRSQVPSQVVPQARSGPYHGPSSYIPGAPGTRTGQSGSSIQYFPVQQQQSYQQQYHPRQGTIANQSSHAVLNPNDPNIQGKMNPQATSYDPATGNRPHRKPTK